jgi:acetoin:2,6-dichlorophenolindophenol oxidoreductase subunit beta
MRELSYREAVQDGLAEEMDRDERVVLLGEDVAPGGVFNVTPALAARFGPNRVIDTPISELGFTGAAFGAAVRGLRPVVEIMFGDFLGLVIDTIVNQSSKYWYLSNEQASIPLVVRSAVGAGARLGACHSQTPTGWFLGEPGLKLAAPATPADAKGLTMAAIRDDNPVVVFEHKLLYGRKGEVLEGDEALVPLGKAAVRRRGGDVTIAAALRMVEVALEAAEQLSGDGIEAEVIDLRTLRPLDTETIAESSARTGRLVVVEEGPPTGGYAADVIATAAELAGPLAVRRVTTPDLPIPFSKTLEDAAIPDAAAVTTAVRSLAA